MTDQTRTMRYEGLYPSQVQERFQADAAEAARNGWFPSGQSWVGQELVVTYVYGDPRRWAAPGGPTTAGGPQPYGGVPPITIQTSAVHPASAVVMVAGLMAAVGSFLPWVSASNGFVSVSRTGMDGGDGWITLVLGLAIMVGGFSAIHGPKGRTWLTVLIAAIVTIGVALLDLRDVFSRMTLVDDSTMVQVGIGLWLILAGGLIAAIASFGMRRRQAS